MKKGYYLLCLLALTSISVSAQVFTTWWQQSGPYCERSLALCTDKAGNVYQLLNYQQGTTLDGIVLPHNTFCRSEVALIKYNSAGNVLWTVTVEAIKKTSNDTLLEEMYVLDTAGEFSNVSDIQPNVGVDGLGYLYFSTQLRGIPGDSVYVQGKNQTRVGTVFDDGFMLLLVKTDTAGQVVRIHTLNTRKGAAINAYAQYINNYSPNLRSFALTNDGSLVAVQEMDSVYYDQLIIKREHVLCKYDTQGNFSKVSQDSFSQHGFNFKESIWFSFQGLNTDRSDNLYFTTLLLSQYDDSLRLQHPRFLYGETINSGIIKLNASGRQWFSAITACPQYLLFNEFIMLTTTPRSGRTYVSKWFRDLPCWQLLADGSEQTHFSAGLEDALLIGVDSNGYEVWTKKWGGTGKDMVTAIASDSLDNVYVCGYTTSPELVIDSFHLYSSGAPVFFMAILDSSGKAQKILQLNGNLFTYGQFVNLGLFVTAPGKGFIHGKFTGTVNGLCPPPVSVGKDDAFILGFGWPDTIQLTGCRSVVSPSGKVYTREGFYDDTIAINGCNRLVIVSVQLNERYHETNQTACNRFYLSGVKRWYNQSGDYYDTLNNSFGCDSIVLIHLRIHPQYQQSITVPFCRSYISPGGQLITQSGLYADTLKNQYGCDSLVLINAVSQASADTLFVQQCHPFTLPGSGRTVTQSGTYTDTLLNREGCDSILYIHFKRAYPSLVLWVSNRITCDTPEAWLEATADRSTVRWYPPEGITNPNEPVTKVRATVSGWYYAEATHELGCKAIDSVWLEVNQGSVDTEIGNVFTPDGDGLNDCFGGSTEGEKLVYLVVFNRWGNEVYAGVECWRGLDKDNRTLPDGTYSYIRTTTNTCGETHRQSSTVLLIR